MKIQSQIKLEEEKLLKLVNANFLLKLEVQSTQKKIEHLKGIQLANKVEQEMQEEMKQAAKSMDLWKLFKGFKKLYK